MEVDQSISNYQSIGQQRQYLGSNENEQQLETLAHQAQEEENYEETQTNPNGFFSDTKTAAACSVRVALRVRPLVGRELYESPNICVTCYPEQDQIVIGKDRQFTFDKVFDIGCRQQDLFEGCVKNLVLGCFAGYNATVLAYGQTGSGKTFTMGSGYTIGLKDEDLGIIPRVIKLIFEEVEKRKNKAEFIIKCTFLEIYNEELNDLLDHGSVTGSVAAGVVERFVQKKDITIREEKNGNISVFGLREEKVNSYEELASCLDRGSNFRSTASTLMNNCSSRSHAIFTISIEQHVIDDLYQPNYSTNAPNTAKVQASAGQDHEEFMVAKFHFVDLAGSERAKRTGATGNTLKEGISINKGLLSLGNVISALTEDNKKSGHVPYRDSKLTRILQDSLGGNSRTSMIACISPAEINFEETLNTLKYASRARNIKNKPIVNRDPNSAQIAQLRQQLYDLQRELIGARKLLISNNIEFESGANLPGDINQLEGKPQDSHQREYMIGAAEIQKYEIELKDLKNQMIQREKKVTVLQGQNDHLSEQLSQTHIEFFSVQKERDIARFQIEQIVSVLKKRNLLESIMKEINGCDQTNNGMDIDEGKTLIDSVFGSSGPTILEEYQVKVKEQTKDIQEKSQMLKTLQRDNEQLIKQSTQDLKQLEAKESEIEKLKRSVNKLQKENVQIKNDQRRGTTMTAARPQHNSNQQVQSQLTTRKMSVLNTERKPLIQQSNYTNIQAKHVSDKNLENEEQLFSSQLDQNIKQFNELFISNLSQSLSSMLVQKKTGQQDEIMKTPGTKNDGATQLNEIQEFRNDGTPNQNEDIRSDSDGDQNSQDEDGNEIEDQILPQTEKECQEVIESNEETKKQDEEIQSMLNQHEQQILSIEGDLKQKEDLLKAIKETHSSMSNQLLEVMKNEYHKKIQQFQSEMQQLEQQRIEDLKKADNAQQKSKLEDSYKKKLKDLEDKLRDAKQKEKEQQNMQKQSSQYKLKIHSLEKEIEKMKVQKVTMVKQMKEESEKHRKWKADRAKELMQIKQQNLKKDREIQLLKRENKRKDILAKQKSQELSALMKKTRIEKQKQINASKDRQKKKNIDIGEIQRWIMTNTEKMIRFKELQFQLEQELTQRQEVENQITEEQTQLAQLSVRREKLEFQKCQIEQNLDQEFDGDIYEINEEISSLSYEMKAIYENIETLEEKFDFIESKASSLNKEILDFSPDDVQQLRFDQVQSIEGARACLGAFFGILLDVNVYKKQLENQVVLNEGTIESISQQLDQLRHAQQVNEIAFQRELEQLNKEYQQKEEILVRIIMENGGQEIEQLLANLDINAPDGRGSGKDLIKELIQKTLGNKEAENEQNQLSNQTALPGRRNTTANQKQAEIQKIKEQSYNQSKTALSRRVAELERKTKDDQKKLESIKHKFEQTNQEKEHFKKQLDTMKLKIKNQEIQDVKQSKLPQQDDPTNQPVNRELQKSPRHQNQSINPNSQQAQKLMTLKDARNDRKIKKLGTQNQSSKVVNEPRVIADEPMQEDEDDDIPFNRGELKKTHSTIEQTQQIKGTQQQQNNDNFFEQSNVFARLSQGKARAQTVMGGPVSNNITQSLNTSLTAQQPPPIQQQEQQIKTGQNYEDDKNWKLMFNKEMAHNHNICAIASTGNQLYSTSNKSLKIWDLESMKQISDINAHKNYIKCIYIWKEKNILLTASEKDISLWDMISLTQVGKLAAYSDVKAMTVSTDGNLLFSGGKGSASSAGLLIWDLRKGSSPLEEREKNQDIFSLFTSPEVLFYGCRSHQVIPYNYRTQEQYLPLQPPHCDAVTSLTMLDNVLVSASRDKMFRYWDHQKLSHINVEVAHSDQINCLETDYQQREMYSGSKDGIVKVWRMKDQKARCTAQITASNAGGSVNTITKIDQSFGRWFVTGSSDKALKIFKYKAKEYNEIENNADREMEEVFDRAYNDRNNDFYNEGPDQDRNEDARLLSQLNKLEEVKQQNYDTAQKTTQQMPRSNTGSSSNMYMPGQGSKLEQKRRQHRLQEQQKRYQKENDQNFQQL